MRIVGGRPRMDLSTEGPDGTGGDDFGGQGGGGSRGRPHDGSHDPAPPKENTHSRISHPHADTLPYTPPVHNDPPVIHDVPTVDGSAGGNNLQNLPNQPAPTVRNLTTNALGATIPVTYGQTQIGTNLIFQPTVVGQNLVVAFALGEGPINSVLSVTVDGRDIGTAIINGQAGLGLTAGVQYNIYTGTPSQVVDPLLAAANPLHVTSWPGLAYIAFSFPQPTQGTGNYDPTRIFCEIQGMKCIDPRVDLTTRTYTDVPVLHIFDLMTTPTYGLGVPYVNMDAPAGSSTSTWALAAIDCEFTLARAAQPGAAPTLGANTAGGALSNATYAWTISYTGASGIESIESAASSPASVGQGTQQVVNWVVGPAGTTTIKLYRNRSGILTSPRYLVATFNNNTTVTFTDGVADSALGAVSGTQAKRYAMGLMMRDALAASDWLNTMRAHCMSYLSYNSGLYQIFIDKAKSATTITFTDTGSAANIKDLPSIRSKGLTEIPTKVIVTYTDAGLGYIDQTAEAELPTVATRLDERRELRLSLPGVRTYDQAQRLALHNLNRSAADKVIDFVATAEGVQPLPGDICPVTSSIGLTSIPIIITDCQPDHDGLLWKLRGEFYDPAIYSDTVIANPISLPPPTTPVPPPAITGGAFLTDTDPAAIVTGTQNVPSTHQATRASATWNSATNLNVRQYRVRAKVSASGVSSETWASIGIGGEYIVPLGVQSIVGGGLGPVHFRSNLVTGATDTTYWPNGVVRTQTFSGTMFSRIIVRSEDFNGVQSADTILDGPGIFSSGGSTIDSGNYSISGSGQLNNPTFRDLSIKTTISQSTAAKDALYRITNTSLGYTIAGGDCFEFDIFCDGSSTNYKTGVYVRFTDGTITEGANTLVDVGGLNVHNGNKTSVAREQWYHVKASFLGGHVGKTIDHVGIYDADGTTTASTNVTYVRQILVTGLALGPSFYIYTNGHVLSQATFRDTTTNITLAIARGNFISNMHSDDVTSFSYTVYGSSTTTVVGKWDPTGLVVGNAALSTSATDGFIFMPTCAGVPTGVPTTHTGTAAIVWNSSGNGLYAYSGGSWHAVTGGGGGSTTSSGTYASRPAAGTAGNLYFSTDVQVLSRDTGAAWEEYGPMVQYTPSASLPAFSWRNQGSASVSTAKGGEEMTNVSVSGYNIKGREIACPATPYTITAAFTLNTPMLDNAAIGLYLTDGTKVETYGFPHETSAGSGDGHVYVMDWTNVTTFSATGALSGVYPLLQRTRASGGGVTPVLFLQITDDGTNRIFRFSWDGVRFIPFITSTGSIARTNFLTPTNIGWFMYFNNVTTGMSQYGKLIYWKQT